MSKVVRVVIALVVIGLVGGLILFLLGVFTPKGAGILIKTTPTATVFINGEEVGQTPYEATREAGEVTVKLVPQAGTTPLAPYETRVTLSPKIQTIINREFAATEEASRGEIISFERVGGKEASLAVVSIPDSAEVYIDGKQIGFAPYKTSLFAAGDHQVILKAPNYTERTLSVRTVAGYKLTAVVKLAPSGETTPTPTPTPEEIKVTMVEILTTPTGYLRVRATPSAGAAELAQVEPGEKFRYLETDSATGWFKIEYLPAQAGEKGKEGWVSSQYAKIIEEAAP
jgi:uncharacterized protein YgiM (DUF1202 family)